MKKKTQNSIIKKWLVEHFLLFSIQIKRNCPCWYFHNNLNQLQEWRKLIYFMKNGKEKGKKHNGREENIFTKLTYIQEGNIERMSPLCVSFSQLNKFLDCINPFFSPSRFIMLILLSKLSSTYFWKGLWNSRFYACVIHHYKFHLRVNHVGYGCKSR